MSRAAKAVARRNGRTVRSLTGTLAPYVQPEDAELDHPAFLQKVAERIRNDIAALNRIRKGAKVRRRL